MATFDEFGAQIPDETPVEVPIHIRRLERSFSADEVRRLVRVEVSRAASEAGYDSIQEAEDFDVDDDSPDFLSAYEMKEEFEDRGHVYVEKSPKDEADVKAAPVDAKTVVKVDADKAAPASPAGASS